MAKLHRHRWRSSISCRIVEYERDGTHSRQRDVSNCACWSSALRSTIFLWSPVTTLGPFAGVFQVGVSVQQVPIRLTSQTHGSEWRRFALRSCTSARGESFYLHSIILNKCAGAWR